MAAPTEFTLESVREFMLEKGGKVTNHELVKHFKQFLTDPYTKGKNLSEIKDERKLVARPDVYPFFFGRDSQQLSLSLPSSP